MTDARDDSERAGPASPQFQMATLVVRVPAPQMALFKAIVESYDNLATLRTEEPAEERLKLWFSPEAKKDVESLLRSLAPAISVECISQG